jgi:hypothetical protein
MDFCPYFQAWSNGDCAKASNGRTDTTKNYYGDIYAVGSQCINSNAIWKGYAAPAKLQRWETCAGIICNDAKTSATLTMIAEDGFQVSIECSAADIGKAKTINKFTGTITCPDISIVCVANNKFLSSNVQCPEFLNNCNSPHGSCRYGQKDKQFSCVCAAAWSGDTCKIYNIADVLLVPSPSREEAMKSEDDLNYGETCSLSQVLVTMAFLILLWTVPVTV